MPLGVGKGNRLQRVVKKSPQWRRVKMNKQLTRRPIRRRGKKVFTVPVLYTASPTLSALINMRSGYLESDTGDSHFGHVFYIVRQLRLGVFGLQASLVPYILNQSVIHFSLCVFKGMMEIATVCIVSIFSADSFVQSTS